MELAIKSCVTLILVLVAAGAYPGEDASDISRLAWLGGCWKNASGEPGSGEHWMPLAGGTLLGISRTVRQGETVAFEFMQIRTIENGQLAFIAMPSGQQTTVFPLLSIDTSKAVFENLEHDFPQRVIYELKDGVRLQARIEGEREGVARVVVFPMKRVSCQADS